MSLSKDEAPTVRPVRIPPLAQVLREEGHRALARDLGAFGVMGAAATKATAVVRYADLNGISPSEVIAAGDSFNDLPLLQACGLKIAMGNAAPELKAIADYVAPTAEEDGLAVAIEEFILPQLYSLGLGDTDGSATPITG